MNERSDKITTLKQLITEKVFITNQDQPIDTSENPNTWIFDFRQIVMNGRAAHDLAYVFWDTFKDQYPFQIGTLEIGGVPLATSFMNFIYNEGHRDASAFFIRKSRKKSGLHRMLEGEVDPDKKIILVDDTMNSGNSFWRQVVALEEMGHAVDTVWSIVRYRDESYYQRFHKRGIKVRSLFTLDDFTDSLGSTVYNLKEPSKELPTPFTASWVFTSEKPSLHWVINKSQPILDETKIYVGSDNRIFWAINQNDGSVAWKFQVGKGSKKKSIFSNPAFYKNTVIFGSYDGNLYALDRETGQECWRCYDADWIGSSPAVAEDLELVFIGMEFGVIGKHGGIAALNANTGEVVWRDYSHPALTHGSPLYISSQQEVVIGSNDGVIRLYDATTGTLKWSFTTFGGASYKPHHGGFGNGDIKEAPVYDLERDYIVFGSIDGFLYILQRSNGDLVHHHKSEFGIFAPPIIHAGKVYYTSIDKHVRCIDLDTFAVEFETNLDGTRLFGPPTVIEGRLYVGTNAARLHEVDMKTGTSKGYLQVSERITNHVVYNPKTDRYFLPTFANEIIALKRTKPAVDDDTEDTQ